MYLPARISHTEKNLPARKISGHKPQIKVAEYQLSIGYDII